MTEKFAPVIFVDVYQTVRKAASKNDTRAGEQKWRWRALSEGNRKKLASSGEAFHNLADCLHSIDLLFSDKSNVYLRQHEQGDQVLRMATNNEPPF
jgi:hypothetical protein